MNSITLLLPQMNEDLNKLVSQVRRDILRMVHAVNSGHPGGSLGCVEFFVTLYKKILRNESDLKDMFILSNGHISPVYYSILARTGHFELSELSTFRKINSRLQGHPTNHDGLPGVNVSTGSLGQVLSVGVGIALIKKDPLNLLASVPVTPSTNTGVPTENP